MMTYSHDEDSFTLHYGRTVNLAGHSISDAIIELQSALQITVSRFQVVWGALRFQHDLAPLDFPLFDIEGPTLWHDSGGDLCVVSTLSYEIEEYPFWEEVMRYLDIPEQSRED